MRLRCFATWVSIGVLLVGCTGDDRPPSSDLGVDLGPSDMGSPDANGPDSGSPDLGPSSCDGPPGLYEAGSGCLTLASSVFAYAPRFQLWSDAAEKERFVYLPPGSTIDTSDADNWVFPVGTRFYKTFSRGGMRLETRIIEKVSTTGPRASDNWTHESWGWNQSGTDVTLVPSAGLEDVLGTTHDIPSQAQCRQCHVTTDFVLGFGAIQLNHVDTDTTLSSLENGGWLTDAIPPSAADVPGTPTQVAALGYLHANCGHCHGGANPPFGVDMRLGTGLVDVCETSAYRTLLMATIDSTCTTSTIQAFWGGGAYNLVEPNDADTSAIWLRMNARPPEQVSTDTMPPVGTEERDTDGLQIVADWIEGGI